MVKNIHSFRNYIAYFLLFICALLWLYVGFFGGNSDCGYGGADNIMHYLFARYSFQHPELFLHHWGKPLFTIIASPFALMGIKAVYLFNIVVSLLSCYFCWKIAQKTGLKHSPLVIVLLALSPVFFLTTPTALTEPLFALFISVGLLLFVRKKYIASAIVFSFTIFIRTESYVLFPIYASAYLFVRQWKAIPLLLTGFLVFSLLGIPVYGDFFWFFSRSPYVISDAVYGKGNLFHYVLNYKLVFGLATSVLILLAGVFLFIKFVKGQLFRDMNKFAFYFLVTAVLFVFIAAHSFYYWKIGGASMGLLRVMTAILPFAAITAMIGYDSLLRFLKIESGIVGESISVIIMVISLVFLFKMQPGLVFKSQPDEILMKETCVFLLEHFDDEKKIVYFHPLIPFYMNQDPWSESMHSAMEEGFPNVLDLNSGDIIVWDAHFGPNEGGIAVESLLNEESLQLFMIFYPEIPFETLGGFDYEIYCFQKLPPGEKSNNFAIAQDKLSFLKKKYSIELFKVISYKLSDSVDYQPNEIVADFFVSDDASFKITTRREFLSFLEMNYNQFYLPEYKKILIEYNILVEDKNGLESFLVISIEKNGKCFLYNAIPLDFSEFETGNWQQGHACVSLIPPEGKNTIIKCYIWNVSTGGTYYIDDVTISLLK